MSSLSNLVYLKDFSINNNDNTIDLNYSIPNMSIQGKVTISLKDYTESLSTSTGDDYMDGLRTIICKTVITNFAEMLRSNSSDYDSVSNEVDSAMSSLNKP